MPAKAIASRFTLSARTRARRRLASSPAWRPANPLPPPEAEALEFFLLERYVGYTRSDGELWRMRIHHRRWSPRRATIEQLASTMLEAAGLPRGDATPLAHAQTTPLDVGIWPPERIGSR